MSLPPHKIAPADLAPGARLPVEEPFYARGDDGVDLRGLLDVLLRGKWIVLGAFLIGVVLAGVYSLVTPSRYSSYAVLLVQKKEGDFGAILPKLPNAVGGGAFGSERNLSNELLVLRQSYPLALSVAERLLQQKRIPGTDRPLTILEPADGDAAPPSAREVAFRLQGEYVTSELEEPDADAIRVGVESTDPEEAAFVANLYAAAFQDRTQESSRSGITESREYLERQVATQEDRLKDADAAVRRYLETEGGIALDEESSRIVERIADLQAQRDEAGIEVETRRASISALEEELQRIEPNLAGRLGSGLDAELEAAQERLVELQGDLDTFYSENPRLRESAAPGERVLQLRREVGLARDRIREISERLTDQSLATATGPGDQRSGFERAAELRSRMADERVSLDEAIAQRDQLAARLSDYEGELSRVPEQLVALAQLEREREAREQLYGGLEVSLQEARLAEESQLGYAQVIRPAFVAAYPFAPHRLRNVALGGLLGLVIGCVVAVGKVRLDHRIHRPDDLKALGAPVLATIPSTTDLIQRDFGGKEAVDVGGREVDAHLVSLLNPMAAASEAYRALRTAVQFSRPDVVVKTVLVTSSNPSEGKSTTAANLAVVLAQAGRRVLLVDADLRKPTAHKKFGVPREPGLVQHLFESGPVDVASLPEVADDLWLLPAGKLVPNTSELLGSKRMRDVIEDLRDQFDVVVFDTPPVLAATDSALLSTQCDATVVVCRAGQTNDHDVEAALEALRGVGASVIGSVLNGFDIAKSYGYKSKYASRYGSDYAYGSPAA
ncbi:polysaccharide biosynthesis tyrosine autokinase [Rubrivirga sp. S365]|uniref:non-specific protein-tyrosine kinase n=1 Tax=Rubrivirga litoralis TaxID=3075598 RepID=A0ABU3BRE4_9BACT|nr:MULTISPECIES: polysaccharide biosynthesis tyrosine autokinase [unclassified Rubrivirga]MDT0631820.1 polysaccharide biosynthesis tyrosine autokinase [Rubrivirga sp. F394]MDT7856488.1 polysaccharide biosynthesis tyrosine autokinase [Rubrivirga sp. S365]